MNDNENVVVIKEETVASESDVRDEPVDENMFFATGHFSIHQQPSDHDDAFIGE